ncbi:hypothetical protein GCM10011452_25620 [Gemmobacter lanyuensis]|uniref:AAA+ family ATPase n=1 Tax=Gemmobacter lanyuensis TaxID=1054497 RepID=A0A918IZK1_9RHOB|nr:AAA+ family ATPase [Gemmobacter lanyuensis]GGW36052.1 hypothetical protein GCM10011452_25620 [Gemmobacter lanyuensis]
MTRIALALTLILATAPFARAEAPAPTVPEDEAPGLMQRGAEMFLRGLMSEMEPSLREMEEALRELQPEMRKLLDLIGDFQNYEAPEKLPNGDILIRRKPTSPETAPGADPDEGGQIDL